MALLELPQARKSVKKRLNDTSNYVLHQKSLSKAFLYLSTLQLEMAQTYQLQCFEQHQMY